jgi:hypothetical protein
MPLSMDERARKMGMNEALFREVNERIEELADTLGLRGELLELVCECGDASCTQHIRMIAQEYESIRKDPTLFAIFPGHEQPDVEDVVANHDGYDVVRKHAGGPAELAKSTDPRT